MSTAGEMSAAGQAAGKPSDAWGPLQWVIAVVVWLWVLVPLGYGLYQLVIKIPALFG
ncbi:MFS transporter small subunit [Pseudonocardia sp. CA-142604]|uniref:MFS transporter small subunit n=1 Tax=Pseudonocardia sp. CA-142604 TaxID=3240024 RepID=UPI003D92B66D